jgi:uncharacterized membrane protein
MNGQSPINFGVFSEALDLVKARWQPLAMAGLIAFGAIMVVEIVFMFLFFVIGLIGGRSPGLIFAMFPVMAVFWLVLIFVQALTQAGFATLALKVVQDEPFQPSDMLLPLKTPGPYIAAAILITISTLAGVAACFVGVYVVAGLMMFVYPFMVDKKMAPMDAWKLSIETLKPHWLMATVFYFVACLIGGLGAIACGIGIIVTLPLMYISIALLYRDLVLNPEKGIAPIVTPVAKVEETAAGPEPGEPEPPRD